MLSANMTNLDAKEAIAYADTISQAVRFLLWSEASH